MKYLFPFLIFGTLVACKPAPLEEELVDPTDPTVQALAFDQEHTIRFPANTQSQVTTQDYAFVMGAEDFSDFQICVSSADSNCYEQAVKYIVYQNNVPVHKFFSGEYSSATYCSKTLSAGKYKLRIELSNASCGSSSNRVFVFTPSYR